MASNVQGTATFEPSTPGANQIPTDGSMGADVAGNASAQVVGGANVDAGVDAQGQIGNVEAQGDSATSAVKAHGETAAGIQADVDGGAQAQATARVSDASDQADVGYQRKQAESQIGTIQANAEVDAGNAAIDGAGVRGEVDTYDRVQDEKAYREGQVDEARADQQRAREIQADPSGSAKDAARTEAEARVQAATPESVTRAQGNVDLARDAAADPTAMAEGEAEVKVEGTVGVDLPPLKK